MKAIIKLTDSSGPALLCENASPENVQVLVQIISICKVVTTDYHDNVSLLESTLPIIKFIPEDTISEESQQILEENKKVKSENSDLWLKNYMLNQELEKLKNPPEPPVVGVDSLNF